MPPSPLLPGGRVDAFVDHGVPDVTLACHMSLHRRLLPRRVRNINATQQGALPMGRGSPGWPTCHSNVRASVLDSATAHVAAEQKDDGEWWNSEPHTKLPAIAIPIQAAHTQPVLRCRSAPTPERRGSWCSCTRWPGASCTTVSIRPALCSVVRPEPECEGVVTYEQPAVGGG